MPLTTILDGTQIIDNLGSTSPLDWAVALPQNITVPEGLWFSTSQLQLQLQIFMSVVTNPNNTRRNTERFLNPIQSQIGHWALLTDDFVLDDGRIQYQKQAIVRESALITTGKTRGVTGRRFNTTTNTKAGHAQLLGGFPICGTSTSVGAVIANQAVSSARVATGSICLAVGLGQIEMTEVDVFQPGSRVLPLVTTDFCLPDLLQGVLWGGYQLEVGWLLGYNDYDSIATFIPSEPLVSGATIGQDYLIACQLGLALAVPGSPNNIQPPAFGYLPNGQPKFSAFGTVPPDPIILPEN